MDKPGIIFLDVDGVLNCMPDKPKEVYPDLKSNDERIYGINPDLVKNLKKIIDETDAKIVVSSSWRHFEDYYIFDRNIKWRELLAGRLGKKVNDIIIGNTPSLVTPEMYMLGIGEYYIRGKEIAEWMRINEDKYGKPGVGYKYCILDDEVTSILKYFDPKYVMHTNYKTGLTDEDATKVIHILETA